MIITNFVLLYIININNIKLMNFKFLKVYILFVLLTCGLGIVDLEFCPITDAQLPSFT